MSKKQEIIHNLQRAKDVLAEAISMIDSNKNCIDIGIKIRRVILSLEMAQRQLLNNYLEVCLDNLLKDTYQGKRTRNEIINLFQT